MKLNNYDVGIRLIELFCWVVFLNQDYNNKN